MRLQELIEGLGELRGDGNLEIADLAYDSREVVAGGLFFCIDGTNTDGHLYAPQAVERGAVALVVTRYLDLPVTQVLVEDGRAAMARISCRFFGNPAAELTMIGVTGTKGKTSVTYLLEGIGRAWGKTVGLMGTIENRVGNIRMPAKLTTPQSLDLQRMLRRMVEGGVEWVVMEVAAHGLTYKRVEGIRYDVAVFTNLSRDHLDDYGTMENYLAAKRMLFTPERCVAAAVNADDPAARGLVAPEVPALYFGIEQGDMRGEDIALNAVGDTRFVLRTARGRWPVRLSVPGRFNVYNALAAACAASALGVPEEVIAAGMADVRVPGRCEVVGERGGVTVVRDYAHSPDSVQKVLEMFREFAAGRILTVVGCGGNRDRGKRPIMGELAGRLSDFTVITSDNPRREDPEAILDEVEAGIRPTGKPYVRIENRREAICYALTHARPGDIVLIAGKGHETYQEIQGVRHRFDEKEVVAQLLEHMEDEGR